MIEFTFDGREFTNDFLQMVFEDVSPDISDGSILQEQDSGRDGAGGITFTPNTDATGFSYPLYLGRQLTAQQTRIVQGYVDQLATQGSLGGRLLTLVDFPETAQNPTVQVAINILADGRLQAVRANAPYSGIVLRGIDQGGDAQMTLLGISSTTINAQAYLEIEVVHHTTVGSVTVWADNVLLWELPNINTAISGSEQSTSVYWGGYGVTGPDDDTLHHEDLNAVISDIFVINGSTNPDDPNDPAARIGDHKPLLSLPTADATYAQYTPDPVRDHFLNVDEIPPDLASENYASELSLRDNFAMSDVVGTESQQVYLSYTGLVKTDIASGCSVSGEPATFQNTVLCVQPAPGTITSDPDFIEECALSDFASRRFETVCTISRDGESVSFREYNMSFTEHVLGMSPLSNPPFLCQRDFAGAAAEVIWNHSRNMRVSPGGATYALQWYQPWAGYAIASNVEQAPTASGDKIEFKLNVKGASIDIGFVANVYDVALFPYEPVEAAFHFRWDLPSSPYFFCSNSFVYNGETVFTYEDTDLFSITLTPTTYQLRQNNILVAEITPAVMPAAVFTYCFAGRWRYNEDINAYDEPPGLQRCVAYVSGTGCVNCGPAVPLVTEGAFPAPPAIPGPYHQWEITQWGIYMQGFEGYGEIFDPIHNEGPGPIPNFLWDLNTIFTFKLDSGNVLLEITNPVGLTGIPEVAGKGVWTYSRPYADTDDFFLQPPVPPVGVPVDGNPKIDKTMLPTPANVPLRLVGMPQYDEIAGITDTSFQFVPAAQVKVFKGFMRQGGQDRDGTEATALTEFLYRQSFLSSLPGSSEPITLGDANSGEHGYSDPE